MSWRDDFDDASLDSVKFGTSVSGDGAIAEASGTLNMTMGAATANAAITYIKDPLGVSTEKYLYTLRHKIDGTTLGNVYLIGFYDGTPAVDVNTNVNTNYRGGVGYSTGNGIFLAYIDTGGTVQYWTGTAWTTTLTYFAVNSAYWLDISLVVKAGKFRFSITYLGDTKSLVETLYVNFSSLKAYTTLRIFWGEIFTNYYYNTSMKSEYCIFSNETPVQAYYNGTATGLNPYYIARAISFNGGSKYFRDPIATPTIIAPLAGESHSKDPFVALVAGTYYLFYSAFITATSKWRIRYATSSDQETWTDQGYITTPGGAGAYDEKGHRFPVATINGSTWRVYVGGQDGSDIITVGYFYGDDLASLTNYASNPVIDVGAGGAWNDASIMPTGITASGSTVSLHVTGLKSGAKWQGGIYISTNWIVWSADAGNPIIVNDVSKRTTASNVTANDITLTVGNSTIFSNDDPIVIADAANYHTNRVLSKADATHITLYYPSPHAYTDPTVWGYNAGSVCQEGPDLANFPNDLLVTSFQTAGNILVETTAWWHYNAGWIYDPSKTPPLSLGVGWDATSSENLKWIHTGIILAATRYKWPVCFFRS